MLLDTHCHLDAYPDTLTEAEAASRARVLIIAMTNTPAAFDHLQRLAPQRAHIRLALGLHPLEPSSALQWHDFESRFTRTSYIGEVGLDFSRAGVHAREGQVAVFRRILALLKTTPKFVSVHSRRAETATLDLLEEFGSTHVVFHWFAGNPAQVERLLRLGHLCSVNPAMLRSRLGRGLVDRLPPDRVLTETDGPFVRVGDRPARPEDVVQVVAYLAAVWGRSLSDVQVQLVNNLRKLVPPALA